MTRPASRTHWIVLAGLVLGACSLAYPRTLLDSPASTYIGGVILEGGVPYRDAWDVRAPGIYFIYALQMLLFGKSAIALRAFDVLWQVVTALVLSSIAIRLYQKSAVGTIAAVAYLVVYFSHNFWNWSEPDTFLTLPLALAFLFLQRGLERRNALDWLIVGCLIGIAALFKLPYGLFGILPLSAVIIRNRRDSRWLLVGLSGLAAGFATPLLIVTLYFWAAGALQDFLEAQLVFAPVYLAQVHRLLGFRDFLRSALRPVLIPFYVMAAIGLGTFVIRSRGAQKPRLTEVLLVGWFVVALTALLLHGSYLGYHYMALFAPVGVLFANALYESLTDPGIRQRWVSRSIIALSGVALFVAGVKISEHVAFTRRVLAGDVPDAAWRDLGRYIKDRTAPDERIFVWGNVPLVYLYADRKAASRFLPTAFLSIDVPRVRYRQILLEELGARKPLYLVLSLQGSVTPALPDAYASFQSFPALREMVAANYTLEEETANYRLYRRKS